MSQSVSNLQKDGGRPCLWTRFLRRKLFGDYALLGHYRAHPDKNQEDLFFALLRECVADGTVTEEMIRREMDANHVRKDAPLVLRKAPKLEQVIAALPAAA